MCKKILILGSELKVKEATSYSWHKLSKGINVADYDVLILNFSPLQSKKYSQSIDINLLPDSNQFARLLFSQDSIIFVIGDTSFSIGSNPYKDPNWWIPIKPNFLMESGDTISIVEDETSFYFNNVKKWDYCFTGWEFHHPDFLKYYMKEAGIPNTSSLKPKLQILAKNRYSRPIGFSFSLEAVDSNRRKIKDSGLITWLPPVTEISVDESILLILQEIFKISPHVPPPDWIIEYSLPNEKPVVDEIEKINQQIKKLDEDLQIKKMSYQK